MVNDIDVIVFVIDPAGYDPLLSNGKFFLHSTHDLFVKLYNATIMSQIPVVVMFRNFATIDQCKIHHRDGAPICSQPDTAPNTITQDVLFDHLVSLVTVSRKSIFRYKDYPQRILMKTPSHRNGKDYRTSVRENVIVAYRRLAVLKLGLCRP